jgi:hypothetical protein
MFNPKFKTMKNQITENHLNEIINTTNPNTDSGLIKVDEVLTKEFWDKFSQAKSELVNYNVNLILNSFVSSIEEDIKEKAKIL